MSCRSSAARRRERGSAAGFSVSSGPARSSASRAVGGAGASASHAAECTFTPFASRVSRAQCEQQTKRIAPTGKSLPSPYRTRRGRAQSFVWQGHGAGSSWSRSVSWSAAWVCDGAGAGAGAGAGVGAGGDWKGEAGGNGEGDQAGGPAGTTGAGAGSGA